MRSCTPPPTSGPTDEEPAHYWVCINKHARGPTDHQLRRQLTGSAYIYTSLRRCRPEAAAAVARRAPERLAAAVSPNQHSAQPVLLHAENESAAASAHARGARAGTTPPRTPRCCTQSAHNPLAPKLLCFLNPLPRAHLLHSGCSAARLHATARCCGLLPRPPTCEAASS